MTKTLIVMHPCLADRNRSRDPALTQEGRRQAASVATELRKAGITADFAMHARALRALETTQILVSDFNARAAIPLQHRAMPWLSEDSSETFIAPYLRRLCVNHDSVLLVTHQDKIGGLLCGLQGMEAYLDARNEITGYGWTRVLTSDARTWMDFLADTAKKAQDFKPRPPSNPPPPSSPSNNLP